MSLYEVSLRTSNVTTSQAAVEIVGSNVKRTRLYEIGFTLATAVSTTLGFGRPAAIGVTPATSSTFQGDENDNVAISKAYLTWATSPTAPTIYLRRFTGSAVGSGAVWVFPEGIAMDISGIPRNLVLFNIVGGATLDLWAVVGE